jgi:drug/metabolite transporter (DMT)-like permease
VHAAWNLLLARARDPQAATALAGAFGALVFLPVAVATWDVDSGVAPYAAVSALLELGYLALLAYAYTRADLSAIYPIARGSAPVLVLIGSVVALGASPSPAQVAGVVAVAVGVLLVRGLRRTAQGGAAALGLGVGALIAAYTVVDKKGLEFAAPLPYLELVIAPSAFAYLAWMAHARGRAIRAAWGPSTALAGLGMLGAFGLALAALKLGPAAGVAAVRETSILIATAFGAVFLREPVGGLRAAGAVAIVLGVIAVALG